MRTPPIPRNAKDYENWLPHTYRHEYLQEHMQLVKQGSETSYSDSDPDHGDDYKMEPPLSRLARRRKTSTVHAAKTTLIAALIAAALLLIILPSLTVYLLTAAAIIIIATVIESHRIQFGEVHFDLDILPFAVIACIMLFGYAGAIFLAIAAPIAVTSLCAHQRAERGIRITSYLVGILLYAVFVSTESTPLVSAVIAILGMLGIQIFSYSVLMRYGTGRTLVSRGINLVVQIILLRIGAGLLI
ncbi:MAG: hypothetical protein ABIH41_07435 [Nanoarchaeota archaeon]